MLWSFKFSSKLLFYSIYFVTKKDPCGSFSLISARRKLSADLYGIVFMELCIIFGEVIMVYKR